MIHEGSRFSKRYTLLEDGDWTIIMDWSKFGTAQRIARIKVEWCVLHIKLSTWGDRRVDGQ